LSGESKEKRDDIIARFSRETVRAGQRACEELKDAFQENPEMLSTVLETLVPLLDDWASYHMALADMLGDPEKIKTVTSEIPSIVYSILSSVYGEKVGEPLAVLVLLPGSSLIQVISKCGHKTKKPIVEPNSWEARLRATILQGQTIVYRVYFQLSGLIEEEESASAEEGLWRPEELRFLYM
jgi:hypothetical protein